MNTSTSPLRILNPCSRILLFVWLMALSPQLAHASAGNADFPLYPVISDNVQFWKDVYTKYSLNTAVIHDKEDLSIVYEVVPVTDEHLPGAKKSNTILLDGKKKHYSALLRRLCRTAPTSNEERRIAAMFSGRNAARKMAMAAESIRIQTGQKERFLEGVVRSGAYMAAIKKIFRAAHMPEDLAYLPHVESSFNTKAYSKLGASGVWQFTYSTGKNYLRIDSAVDERGDPIAAAHAAVEYLKNSYNQLGNWPLALTSYNYGTGGMVRALKEKGSYERIFREYDKGHFKFASRNFYSEFLAAMESAKELEKNPAVRLDQPEPTRSVTIRGKASLREIKKRFGVSEDTLQRLNPALRPTVFSGQRSVPAGYVLHLPAPAGMKEEQPVIADSSTPDTATTGSHRVKKGETLHSLARRYGISAMTLAKANDIDNGVIRIGQRLRIPTATAQTPRIAVSQPTSPAGTTPPKPTTSGIGLSVYKTTVFNGKRYGKIQVQPGESLELLAQWTATSPAVLQRLNRLGEDEVHPGRHLVLLFDKVSIGIFQKKRLHFHQKTGKDYFSSHPRANAANMRNS